MSDCVGCRMGDRVVQELHKLIDSQPKRIAKLEQENKRLRDALCYCTRNAQCHSVRHIASEALKGGEQCL